MLYAIVSYEIESETASGTTTRSIVAPGMTGALNMIVNGVENSILISVVPTSMGHQLAEAHTA